MALDDIDFFHVPDFVDTSAPHHEHIFAVLILISLVFAVWPTRPPVRLGSQGGPGGP